jgi:O-antigen/teichoic acid export membrane protein
MYAKEGIYLLSGSAYDGSVLPMQIIMPTLLLIGVTNILGIQILVPLGKEIVVLYSEIAGAVTDLILNALLIPRMGSAGAAIGTLAAEAVVLIVQYRALRNEVRSAFEEIPYLKIILALTLAVGASFWLKYLSIPLFFTLLLSASCFFLSYLIIMFIGKEPLVMEIAARVFELTSRYLPR